MTEEGPRNVKSYAFNCREDAEAFFARLWVARVLVDPLGAEVASGSGLNPLALQKIRRDLHVSLTLCRVIVEVRHLYSRRPDEVLELQLYGSATISQLKAKIEDACGAKVALQKVIHDTTPIADHKQISSLSVRNDSGARHLMMVIDARSKIERLSDEIRRESLKKTDMVSIKRIGELRKLKKRQAIKSKSI